MTLPENIGKTNPVVWLVDFNQILNARRWRQGSEAKILVCPRCNADRFTMEGDIYICGNPACQAQIIVTARIIGYGEKGNDKSIIYGQNFGVRRLG